MPERNKIPRNQRQLPRLTRVHRKVVTFNDNEIEAISGFCKKYKIQNEAKFFREAIIATILRKTEEDHPTLF